MSITDHHNVRHPSHYIADGFECREIEKALSNKTVRENVRLTPQAARLWFAAFEYLWRWPFKNKVEDLEKCRDNIDELIPEMKFQGNFAQTAVPRRKVTWKHDEHGNIVRETELANEGCNGSEILQPTDDLDWAETSREY